jgi:RNA polymerase sigma-70 factor (ECF subfamily)
MDQWQPGTRLDSWLFRIMHSIRISQLRRVGVERRANGGGGNGAGDPSTAEAPEASIDGAHVMDTKMMLDSVRRAFTQLPEEQRSVMMLVCVEGLAYRQVAETLEIPIGTVMSRLARARVALHRLTGQSTRQTLAQPASQPAIGDDHDAR